MGNVDIAIEKFKELDKRNICDYFVDKIPFAGHHLKLNRMKRKGQRILRDLEKDMIEGSRDIDMTNIVIIDRLMREHNKNSFYDAKIYHSAFGWLCGVGGLVGTGYALGSYFAN